MRRASALSVALVCLVAAACGDGGSDAATAPAALAVPTKDIVKVFAPLVRLDERELALPAGAGYLIAHSGLEWSNARRCTYGYDVTTSATLDPDTTSQLPRLVSDRLGERPGYEARALRSDCEPGRGATYSTTQRTRPFDRENRPAGLPVDEGFNLDIASDFLRGKRRLGPDGSLDGVPTYFALERAGVTTRPGIRISYWMVFGLQQQPNGSGVMSREGDWERVDVVARSGQRRDTYVPLAVEYHANGRARRVAWNDIELAGGTHPVAYLDRGMHTPRPERRCRDCLDWKTWNRLRDVRREAWFGYGGGWGALGASDEESGPSGPSPLALGPAP